MQPYRMKSNMNEIFEPGDEVVVVGLSFPFRVDRYHSETDEYQLFLPGENRKNGKPYSLVFAQRAVVRPNTPLWCQHLGFVPKEIKMIPASQMHSYTDIHKAKREAQKLAGISETLERDLRMKMDLACGQGNYSCIYNATSHAEAELITRFLQDHGYNAYTLGQDIQISW